METTARRAFTFAFWFLVIFMISFGALYFAGVVPEEIQPAPVADTPAQVIAEAKGEEPIRIVIKSIGVNALVSNPETTDVDVLDADLAKGSVRYPGSGLAGEGNMFLFGHSTGIKVGVNKAYQTFNNIKTLNKGDLITVYSKDKEYIYEVDKVTLVNADDALVEFGGTDKKLTLSTCNTFGTKEQRHVVESHLLNVTDYTNLPQS